jgi:hypothetical protein
LSGLNGFVTLIEMTKQILSVILKPVEPLLSVFKLLGASCE